MLPDLRPCVLDAAAIVDAACGRQASRAARRRPPPPRAPSSAPRVSERTKTSNASRRRARPAPRRWRRPCRRCAPGPRDRRGRAARCACRARRRPAGCAIVSARSPANSGRKPMPATACRARSSRRSIVDSTRNRNWMGVSCTNDEHADRAHGANAAVSKPRCRREQRRARQSKSRGVGRGLARRGGREVLVRHGERGLGRQNARDRGLDRRSGVCAGQRVRSRLMLGPSIEPTLRDRLVV